MLTPSRTNMTAAEFFRPPQTIQPTELIDGELIVSPSPVPKLQLVSGGFYTLLGSLIPNGLLFFAPMDVYFDDDNVPQPELSGSQREAAAK
jgi:hypothetical protein